MNKKIKKISSIIITIFMFISILSTNVFAEGNNQTLKEHTIKLGEVNFLSEKTQEYSFNTEEGKLTITVENIPQIKPLYTENWSIGPFDKRISANFEGTTSGNSFFAKMSARFKGTINPYVCQITSVSDGDFNATFISPITGTEKYEIIKKSATTSEYGAEARFRQKYNILGVGQHDMCLYLQLNCKGRANIFMQGIW